MSTAKASRVLGCVLCRQPRMSDGLTVSAPLEDGKPVCDTCTATIGRAWRAATTEVRWVSYDTQLKDGTPYQCCQLQRKDAEELAASLGGGMKVVRVVRRRRRKP